ncbi:MAG TPA: VCBS repeat-containing protein [Candidatus Doudnabacteria bacterium]|nr:VCBS repeat-containing protein [Candidatus Doudnabacteria bacterium]
MQFVKEHFFKLTTLAAICLLIGAQANSWVSAQDNFNDSTDSTPQQIDVLTESLVMSESMPNIPNGHCLTAYQAWSGGSSVYNGDSPYSSLFMPSTNGGIFTDINGDGLPDYVYTYYNKISSNYTNSGCVYLNTGNGWEKVFACWSKVEIHGTTGNIISQRYIGDCAGEEE